MSTRTPAHTRPLTLDARHSGMSVATHSLEHAQCVQRTDRGFGDSGAESTVQSISPVAHRRSLVAYLSLVASLVCVACLHLCVSLLLRCFVFVSFFCCNVSSLLLYSLVYARAVGTVRLSPTRICWVLRSTASWCLHSTEPTCCRDNSQMRGQSTTQHNTATLRGHGARSWSAVMEHVHGARAWSAMIRMAHRSSCDVTLLFRWLFLSLSLCFVVLKLGSAEE